jgi:hypothetical protein
MVARIPLIVEFVSGSWLRREESSYPPLLPLVSESSVIETSAVETQMSYVVFANSSQVSLPTEQIVLFETEDQGARVGFGGMSFEGLRGGELLFCRVKDIWPDEMLPPTGWSEQVALRPEVVAAVYVDGRKVWPKA